MPYQTPDASAYTAMRKLAVSNETNNMLSPLKYRAPFFYNYYRPVYDVNINGNGVFSNKFNPPPLPPLGSTIDDPFIIDYSGSSATVNDPLYTFSNSVSYNVDSATVYVKLTNIPIESDNPGGNSLANLKNIIIEFSSAPNIQTGTFSGPSVPSAQGVYLGNSWQYVFGLGGVSISTFESVVFSFNMVSTTPDIVSISVDLIE